MKLIKPISFFAVFVAASFFYSLSLPNQDFLNQTLYLLFPIIATAAGFSLAKTYGSGNANGKIILIITTGFFMWSMGEIIWYIMRNFMGINPFPSVADFFFLLAYPIIFLGLYESFKLYSVEFGKINKALIFLNSIIALLLILAVLYFGIYGAYNAEASLVNNILAMGYGVADIVLVVASLFSLSLAYEYKGGRLGFFWMTLTLGFVMFLIADILFAMYNGLYIENIKPYVYIDLIWLAGYFLFIYGLMDTYSHLKEVELRIKKRMGLM